MQLLTRCPALSRVNLATYDGDTPKDERQGIRETATIIFTNFDTIHASILPNEDRWRRFMKNLKCVVVDELHYYSGLMGRHVPFSFWYTTKHLRHFSSHVALIMRRFRRVCAAVGSKFVPSACLFQLIYFAPLICFRSSVAFYIMQCHHFKSCQTHEQYIWRGCASCRWLLFNFPLSNMTRM